MGMHSPMPLGYSGVSAVSSSYDISGVWTDGLCTFHVMSMVLSLDLIVGSVSSSSLTTDGSCMRGSSISQVWTASAAQN